MTNWFWVIPWVVIIIFFAGWKIGEIVSKKRWSLKEHLDRENEYRYRDTENRFSNIYNHLDTLEREINAIRFNKTEEEKNNG